MREDMIWLRWMQGAAMAMCLVVAACGGPPIGYEKARNIASQGCPSIKDFAQQVEELKAYPWRLHLEGDRWVAEKGSRRGFRASIVVDARTGSVLECRIGGVF